MPEFKFTPSLMPMPNPVAFGLAWTELLQKSALAWTGAAVKLAHTYTETAAAQAKLFGPLMGRAAMAPVAMAEAAPALVVKAKKAVEPAVDVAADLATAGLKAPVPLPE
jgi:hypothetical protein